jgi:hypothetical protein
MMEFSVWSVIQWVLIVLVAAFIGHFGKVLAQAVLAKMRTKKTDPSPAGPSLSPTQENISPADGTIPGPEGEIGAPSSVPPGADADKADKKRLKTLAKQAKKTAKNK